MVQSKKNVESVQVMAGVENALFSTGQISEKSEFQPELEMNRFETPNGVFGNKELPSVQNLVCVLSELYPELSIEEIYQSISFLLDEMTVRVGRGELIGFIRENEDNSITLSTYAFALIREKVQRLTENN